MLAALSILCTGCAELLIAGHALVAVGKTAEHLLGYHQPAPSPTPELK